MSVKRIKTLAMLSGILLLFSAVRCREGNGSKVTGRHAVVALMDSAELIMNDNPERACQLMDSIDSHSIRSRALQARYALLYTEARYKNYIDETNDSLIMIAVRYYSNHSNTFYKFLSFYYLGCIYCNGKHYNDAILALTQAEQLADVITDDYNLGLLYSQLGAVFFETFDSQRAEAYFKMAADHYGRADGEAHKQYSLFDMSRCKIFDKEYSEAHSLLNDVLDWATDKDMNLAALCLLNQAYCSIHDNNVNAAETEIDKYINLAGKPSESSNGYAVLARYDILHKDYESAKHNLNQGWTYSNSKSDSINLWFVESIICEQTGRLDSAIVYYKKSIDIQNNTYVNCLVNRY